MAPSAYYRSTWGPSTPLPPDQLRPDSEIASLLTSPPRLSDPPNPLELETRTIFGRTLKHWKNIPTTYRDVWTYSARAFSNRPYITYDEGGLENETMTYQQAYDESVRVASWLCTRFQVRRGDRVGIAMRNHLECVTTWWACHLLGAVVTMMNAFADRETLVFCVEDAGCRVLVCDVERWEKVRDRLMMRMQNKGCGLPNDEQNALRAVVVVPFGRGQGVGRIPVSERSYLPRSDTNDGNNSLHGLVHCFESLTRHADPSAPKTQSSPEDYATILYTSGTTGRPKGVVSTHRQSLHNLGAALYGLPRAYLRRHRPLPDPSTNNTDISSILLAYPLFHAAGLLTGLVAATYVGSHLVFMYAWNVDRAVELINTYKLTKFSGVAYQARQLALHPTDMPTLAAISHGGSPSAPELSTEAFNKTNKGIIGQGYGATETNAIATGCFQDDYANWPQSVGFPPPTTELKIMHPDKLVEMPVGKSGEVSEPTTIVLGFVLLTLPILHRRSYSSQVWVRGPGIATGYWNRPQATSSVFLPDGFYRTGDIGYLNTHGALFIQDRLKDLIIRGGENISCAVVENAVYSHPDIIECAAVGLPDANWGERVVVFVVPRPGVRVQDVDEKDIKDRARKVLSKFQVPEFVHVQEQPLPKIPAGKIDKKALREQLKGIARDNKWGDFANVKARL